MTVPLQIVFRDLVPLPSVEPEIRRRVERLAHWGVEPMRCHVAVQAEANRHHQGHVYEVKISLHVPGREIIAGEHQHSQDIQVALHRAFDALDRQLEDHVRLERGQTKQHPPVLQGRIVALGDDGTGRIAGADGEAYHFDRSHCVHPPFEQLTLDQAVHFVPALTRSGREARRIGAD